MKRKKPSPRQKLQKKLDQAWKVAVKERDDYTCQHCGKQGSGSNIHASHVVPRSAGNRLKWDILNGKALCFHCHMNLWHKDPVRMGEWFREKFPDRMAYLDEQRALGHVKYTDADLEDMLKEFED